MWDGHSCPPQLALGSNKACRAKNVDDGSASTHARTAVEAWRFSATKNSKSLKASSPCDPQPVSSRFSPRYP